VRDRRFGATLVLVALVAACTGPNYRLATARANDNRTSGGTLENGILALRVVATPARWFPAADSGPSLRIAAFAAEGGEPMVPGPLLRTSIGTRIRLTLRNALTDTLVLCAPLSNACVLRDTVPLNPGASRTVDFVADRAGAFFYRAMRLRGRHVLDERVGNTQLVGALVVDSTRSPSAADRVLVITSWSKDTTDDSPFVQGINGKTWPHSERFDLAVGDSVHWRVLNATDTEHPMHLHGFYFRVDARGDMERDTVYAPDARPMVVTESVRQLGSALISWAPVRPGNWLFHCHKGFHMSGEQLYHLAGTKPPDSLVSHGADDHPYTTMAGLILGISVRGEGGVPSVAPARRMRLVTREVPAFYADRTPAFVFSLDDGARGRDDGARPIPGPLLTLVRGEPVEISVVNGLHAPTTVHWHGIELESYYDGVGGWSGKAGAVAPMIAPGDSFVARFTPPRSGTFMYHAHADEIHQLASGLYGAIVVLEPGARWNPETDHVLLFSQRGKGDSAIDVLNGGTPADTIRLRAGVTHRLRIVNITVQEEVLGQLHPSTDSTPVSWRVVAKDGMTIPPRRIATTGAHLHISPGETLDAEVSLPRGDYTLDVQAYTKFPVAVRVR
jgi:FtsP/CotA-like multicopper oxidase with cupredoxin domain